MGRTTELMSSVIFHRPQILGREVPTLPIYRNRDLHGWGSAAQSVRADPKDPENEEEAAQFHPFYSAILDLK
jgi:hypothetical protein